MEQFFYTRPREKLRDRGVGALSNAELLQAIIGSGSKVVSAARIAKHVSEALNEDGSVNYDTLVRMTGIGHAKACQLLAALELGARYAALLPLNSARAHPVIPKLDKILGLYYATMSGDGVYIERRRSVQRDGRISEATIRKMFAFAFHDSAHELEVTIGSAALPIEQLDEATLSAVKKIFDMSDTLEVRVNGIWLVNAKIQRLLKRKEVL